MSSQWYYTERGQQRGPVSGEELKSRAASGSLCPDDLVWKEGMAEWAPARKVRGLLITPQAAAAASPPPLPGNLEKESLASHSSNDESTQAVPSSTVQIANDVESSSPPRSDRSTYTAAAEEPTSSNGTASNPELPAEKESPPKGSEAIVASVFAATVASLVLSISQRLFYGYWMSLWSIVASSVILSGALIAILSTPTDSSSSAEPQDGVDPPEGNHDQSHLQVGVVLGLIFGIIYGLWFSGLFSHAFYGSCIGLSVAALAKQLNVSFSWGHAVGPIAVAFVGLHFLGFLGSDIPRAGEGADEAFGHVTKGVTAKELVLAFTNEVAGVENYAGKQIKIRGEVVKVEQAYPSDYFGGKEYAIFLGGNLGPNGYTTWVECFVSDSKDASSVSPGGTVWIQGTVQDGDARVVRVMNCKVLEQ